MCSCGKSKTGTASTQWVHTSPTGVKTPYSTEGDARTAVAREGGTAKPKS